jgi:hypothetical protein
MLPTLSWTPVVLKGRTQRWLTHLATVSVRQPVINIRAVEYWHQRRSYPRKSMPRAQYDVSGLARKSIESTKTRRLRQA